LEILRECSSRELEAVAQLCTPVAVRAGRELCGQGECASQCFIVVDGWANVFVDGVLVAKVGPSELVGELALLAPRGRRCATVTAATDMHLLVLSAAEFSMLQRAAPTVTHRVLREATHRLIGNAAIPHRSPQRVCEWR
jgi:CRP-like cAMP-binding protein